MLGHRRIGRIGQTDFLQADGPLHARLLLAAAFGEKSFDQHLLDVGLEQLALDRAADDLAAAAEHA